MSPQLLLQSLKMFSGASPATQATLLRFLGTLSKKDQNALKKLVVGSMTGGTDPTPNATAGEKAASVGRVLGGNALKTVGGLLSGGGQATQALLTGGGAAAGALAQGLTQAQANVINNIKPDREKAIYGNLLGGMAQGSANIGAGVGAAAGALGAGAGGAVNALTGAASGILDDWGKQLLLSNIAKNIDAQVYRGAGIFGTSPQNMTTAQLNVLQHMITASKPQYQVS